MKPIRHLISIVFLFCGLTAWGGERGYDQNDMVVLQRNDISGSSRKRKDKNEVWKDLIEQVVKDVVR
jgi:hypothetical protein